MAIQSEKTKKNPEKYAMADLLDKEFKTTALEMFKELTDNVENVKKAMCEQNNTSKNQKEILELRSKMIEKESSLERFKDRFEKAK